MPADRSPSSSAPAPLATKVFSSVILGVFGAIGISVLVFLWGSPRNEFGAPPVFARVFGSLIAVAFIAFSAMGVIGVWSGKGGAVPGRLAQRRRHLRGAPQVAAPDSFGCPHCGAGLAADADISPSGDVKCGHCDHWYNTRGSH